MSLSIGEKLYNLRKRDGVSQEMLASSINVSRQAISKWEQDMLVPDTTNLIKVCEYFKVSLDYFIDNKGSVANELHNSNNKSSIWMIIIGAIVIVLSFILTYPMKVTEYRMIGSCFDNPIDYLMRFPILLILLIGLFLSAFGVYKAIKGRKRK